MTYEFETDTLKFSIPIYGTLMLVRGDSGTGKTFICNAIKRAKADKFIQKRVRTTFPLDKTFVVTNKIELESVLTLKDSLIFIDRFDMNIDDSNKDRVINFINSGLNMVILMYRKKIGGLYVSQTSYVSIYKEKSGNKLFLNCRS